MPYARGEPPPTSWRILDAKKNGLTFAYFAASIIVSTYLYVYFIGGVGVGSGVGSKVGSAVGSTVGASVTEISSLAAGAVSVSSDAVGEGVSEAVGVGLSVAGGTVAEGEGIP